MVSNKYHRDFNSYGALKRPGRIDRTVFQDIEDCGDGYGGIQWMMLKAFGTLLFPRFVIEGCEYNGVDTMSNGYIMYDGVPIEVDEQAIVVANGEFLYVNQNGVANTTAVQATAQAEVMIYERDILAVGYDIRFRLIDNVLKVFGLDAQYLRIHHDVIVDEDVEINGDLDMTDGEIQDIKQIDGGGDPIIVDDEFNMNTNQISGLGDPVDLQDAVTLAYLRNMFVPIGTILMYDGLLWVDNTLMPGWYKCDGNNGTPNLVNKFIRGSLVSAVEAGQDSVALTVNNIPTHTSDGQSATHTHLVTINNSTTNHTHSGTSATNVGNHTHSGTTGVGGAHRHGLSLRNDVWGSQNYPKASGPNSATTGNTGYESLHTHSFSTGNQVGTHTHTLTTGNQSVHHTHTNTVGNTSVDHTHTYTQTGFVNVATIPAYYTVIFIMRIA